MFLWDETVNEEFQTMCTNTELLDPDDLRNYPQEEVETAFT